MESAKAATQGLSGNADDATALIHELFERQAAKTPDAVAAVFEQSALTYAQLDERANRLAWRLRESGVAPDERVAICVERGLEMVVGLLGILKAGAAYLPLEPLYPTDRLRYVLADASPKVLLTQEALTERFLDSGTEVIALDAQWPEISQRPSVNPRARASGLRSHHLAYVIYTSGSTGTPKGVMIEHRNVTRLFSSTESWFGFNAGDVWTLFHSFAFDFSVWELWGALFYGGRVVIVPYLVARSPREFYRLLCNERVTVLNQTPSAFAQLVDAQSQLPDLQHSLRVVIFGGEALEFRTLRPWIERNGAHSPQLVNMYGITETTVHVTYRLLSREEIESERGSLIGEPIPDLELYLLDAQRQPVPPGAVGEIHVSGAGLARGYLNRSELTAERFLRNPFGADTEARLYKTGDLGRRRADGRLEYLGRNDSQVKIRGFRIELGEIEAQLAQHEHVKEAVVIAREDVPGEKRLVGYVTADVSRLKAEDRRSAKIVSQWKSLYEETYSKGSSAPSFVGWNSSYTGNAIPLEEMQEWRDNTVQRILALTPRRILEIGCGVGLLLERIAPYCEVYRGIDLSSEAIERLQSWVSTQPDLQHVRLAAGSALDLDAEPNGYDTIILNSVIQYFPDSDYLRAVLQRAASLLCPGGRIFVGDVRHLGLLHTFHSSVQLATAPADLNARFLRERIDHALHLEKELVIDPRFFDDLREEAPQLAGVEVLQKRGHADNELTRYRYDVVLQVGIAPTSLSSRDEDWVPAKHSTTDTDAPENLAHPRPLHVGGIRNGLSRDLAAAALITAADASTTVRELRDLLKSTPLDAEAPGLLEKDIAPSGALEDHHDGKLANDPLATNLKHTLVLTLRKQLKEKLPAHMIPSALVVLETLPLTTNGKLDRLALPRASLGAYASQEYEAPKGEIEEYLAELWQELLQLERVGRNDNFFELGGQSLLIVQMMDTLRRVGLQGEVRTVYERPTLAALADTLGRRSTAQIEVPPVLIPDGCDAITPQMLPLLRLATDDIERIIATVPGGARNVQDIYPLAPLQEGMLFHHLLEDKGGDTYVLPILFSLASRDRLEKFIGALQGVIDRHDILRTAILWENLPQPVQVVYRQAALPVDERPLESHREALEQLSERMRPEHQRLDLHRAPLMRLQVTSDPNGETWYALLQLHHLIHDHASLDTMLAEVGALLRGQPHELPRPVSYRNHVAHSLARAETDDAETFFRKKLADVNEPTAPFGLLNVHGDGRRIEETHDSLDRALAKRVRAQARHLGVSAAALFHAAWALVVSLTSGREDVVFGTVLMGRLQGAAASQRMLGLFINTLPMRLRLEGLTAGELVARAQEEVMELLDHEQSSLALAQRCSAIAGSAPLFTTLLNYFHGSAMPSLERTEATAGIEVLASREWTNYPISVWVEDLGEGFGLTAQTDRRIDPRRITGYLQTAVQSLVQALEQSPQTEALPLSVLPESERREVIELFNATRAPFPQEKHLHELFEEQVARTPQAVAVLYEDLSLTYAELNSKANQLARCLRQHGVTADQPVGICLERSPEMVIGLLGILKAGGAYVPLDPSYPAERLHYMLGDAAPSVLLTQARLRSRLPETAARVLALDEDWEEEVSRHAATNLDPAALGLSARHLAYIIYTSGSTGRPKGAMNEHRGIVNRLQWMQDTYRLGSADRVLQKTPFSFDVSVWEFFWTLMSGAGLVMARPEGHKDPGYLRTLIEQTGVTTLHFVPSMLQSFLDQHRAGDCPGLRHVVCSGEELPAALQRRFFASFPQARLSNLYGPTEAAVDVTAWECRPEDQGARVPIGRPIANIRMYVLDRRRQPVPIGVMGHLYIAGVGVGRGYLNRPELTVERFTEDPFNPAADPDTDRRMYATGDLARWRADGNIEYLGRSDHQVKLRGFRIELGEIEAQLLRHAQVKEAVVIVREAEPGSDGERAVSAQRDVPADKRLVAYLVAADPQAILSVDSLRAHLTPLLPDYMVPSAFVVLDHLPLSPNGKLDRRALPAPEIEAYSARDYESPQGWTETLLSQTWQNVLGVERVGRRDNFFELGGHSLLAMQVIVRIRSWLSLEIPIRWLFELPTVEQLSPRLDRLRQADLPGDPDNDAENVEELLEAIASMPESEVRRRVQELEMGERS